MFYLRINLAVLLSDLFDIIRVVASIIRISQNVESCGEGPPTGVQGRIILKLIAHTLVPPSTIHPHIS